MLPYRIADLFPYTLLVGYKCMLYFIALKIHLSRATFELLSKEKQKWHMVERGEMEMKVLQ